MSSQPPALEQKAFILLLVAVGRGPRTAVLVDLHQQRAAARRLEADLPLLRGAAAISTGASRTRSEDVGEHHPGGPEQGLRHAPRHRLPHRRGLLVRAEAPVRAGAHHRAGAHRRAEDDVDALTTHSFGAGYELARLIVQQPRRDLEQTARFVTQVFLRGVPTTPSSPRLIRIGSRLLGGAAR